MCGVFCFIFLTSANFVYALETIYPNIPFYPSINNTSTLAQYAVYWFGFGIYIALTIAIISLTIAGIQLMTSAGNPGARTSAIDKIKGSLLGLILLVSAFIIIRTINPTLVTPSITSLGEVPGVFYTNGEMGETKPAPISEADTANVPPGFETIIYKCAVGAYSPNLFIWEFPQKNFKGSDNKYDGVSVKEISCGENTNIGGTGSFQMAFKTSGIYYFLGDNCSGFMSGANSSDQNIIEPFRADIKPDAKIPTGNIKSIRVVNEPVNNTFFGIIFHEQNEVEKSGPCDIPRLSNKDEECIQIYDSSTDRNMQTNSASIFKWSINPAYSGTGVDFYSHPYGWTAGSGAGYYNILKEQLGQGVFVKNAGEMVFNYIGIKGALSENCQGKPSCSLAGKGQECCPCKTFQNCFGSMRVRGNYLIAVYSYAPNSSSGFYCQTFNKDVTNFKVTEIIARQNNVNYVNIIPLK